MDYQFGAWRPDLPPLVNQAGLSEAVNVVPVAGGYAPFPSLVATAGATPLTEYARGAITGPTGDGNSFTFVGDEEKLYRFTENGMIDVSRASGYTTSGSRRWEFSQFGAVIVAVNGYDATQQFDLRRDTVFADIPGAVPKAAHCTVAGNSLVLGDIFDPVEGPVHDGIAFSAVGNQAGWPVPGTDEAIAAQSGRQRLAGDGGFVQAVRGGTETLAVFQENAVWRGQYIGGAVIWQLDRVEESHGLLIKGAAVEFGRAIFYISEDGFRVFDFTRSENVGKDVVNRTFLNDLDPAFSDRVSMIRDPDNTRILMAYPGAGHNDAGDPNRLLIWDYVLNQFSTAEVELSILALSGTIAPSLDSPDDPPDDPDSLEEPEAIGEESFDDRQLQPGEALLGAFDTSNVLSNFSGPNLPARLSTGDLQLSKGRRSLLNSVYPMVDGASSNVQVMGFETRREAGTALFDQTVTQEPNGYCYPRNDNRFHRVRLLPGTDWTTATGFEVTGRPTGRY